MFNILQKNDNKFISLNWKMNLNYHESEALLYKIINFAGNGAKIVKGELIIFPQTAVISGFYEKQLELNKIYFGCQNVHYEDFGAYTGETSAELVKSLNCSYVLVGHSERRAYDGENSKIKNRIEKCLENAMIPILCVGENLLIRKTNNHIRFIKDQIDEALQDIKTEKILIAYEPIWAIGTGLVANNFQIQEMIEEIKNHMKEHYADNIDFVYFLYGGSCNEKNFSEILSIQNVDGLLIGGASLNFEKIKLIIEKTIF